MDVEEQSKAVQEIQEFFEKKFKDKPFHAVIVAEVSPGIGLEFAAGNLSSRSPLETWKVIMMGHSQGNEKLAQEFNTHSNIKFTGPTLK